MKSKSLAFLFFCAVLLMRAAPVSAQDGGECAEPIAFANAATNWARENSLRGFGMVSPFRGVLLYAMEIEFSNRCNAQDLEYLVLRRVSFLLETNIPQEAWERVILVRDDNGNLKQDAGEKYFPMSVSGASVKSGPLQEKIPFSTVDNPIFLIMADFREINNGDLVTLKFPDKDKHVLLEPGKGSLLSSYSFLANKTHMRGNSPPELYLLHLTPYNNARAVFPATGSPEEEFDFRVNYRDEDGDAPARSEVWIDENGNGQFEPEEKFAMRDLDPKANFQSYHRFVFKRSFPGISRRTVKFRFYFADSLAEAVKGEAVYPQSFAPSTVFELELSQQVASGPHSLKKEWYLPGEIIAAEVSVMAHYQGAIDFDWPSFKKDFSAPPFVLKGMSVGERRYFNDTYDRASATLFLQLPEGAVSSEKLRSYEVALPPLNFTAKVDGRTGKMVLPPLNIPVSAKPRLEGPFISHGTVKVGEPVMYRFRLVRLSGTPRPAELERLTFRPFVEVGREFKSGTSDGLTVEEFIFTLMLFEAEGEYEIPSFDFSFGKLPGEKVTLFADGRFFGKAREEKSKTSENENLLALLTRKDLPYRERTFRALPLPSWPRAGEMLLALGALPLAVFLLRAGLAGFRELREANRKRTWQEELTAAHRRLRESLALARAGGGPREAAAVHRDITEYLLLIVNPERRREFLQTDARTLAKHLEGSVPRLLLDSLRELEDFLMRFSPDEAELGPILANLDEGTRAVYAQLN